MLPWGWMTEAATISAPPSRSNGPLHLSTVSKLSLGRTVCEYKTSFKESRRWARLASMQSEHFLLSINTKIRVVSKTERKQFFSQFRIGNSRYFPSSEIIIGCESRTWEANSFGEHALSGISRNSVLKLRRRNSKNSISPYRPLYH